MPIRKSIYPKTDVRYWRDRVYKPIRVPNSPSVSTDNFLVRLHLHKKRVAFSLFTTNRDEAAQRARRMYIDLMTGGWDLVLRNHRPKRPEPPDPSRKSDLTFGEYIGLVRSRNLISTKAIDGYVPRLRGIVADILGIRSANKYAAATKGRQAWVDKVDSTQLASVTPDMVRQWKRRSLDKAKTAVARKRAVTSVNSALRQARSLFGERKVLKHLSGIPRPHLFEGVEFEPRVDTRFFGAGIDAPTLLRRAIKDLGTEDLKAFLLAIALGLRRKEADLLQWDSFDFNACTVQIEPTEYHALKTEESASTMSLDAEFMIMFRGWHAQRSGPFVLESDHLPRPEARYHYYRCDATFDSLVDWLRLQGVTGDKPFHVLRKMFGSLIVEKHGVFAASSALRHTSIELTNSYYLDRSVKTVSGLGSILSGADIATLPLPETHKEPPQHKKH
jgi:integrase